MGIAWIPCRIEPDVTPQTLRQVVEEEHRRFLERRGYVGSQLTPFFGPAESPAHDESPSGTWPPTRKVIDLVLLKSDSYPVYDISECELFPLEWRLEAFRTILPDELPRLFQKWMDYRTHVSEGGFRGYLDQLRFYTCHANFIYFARITLDDIRVSLSSTASWTRRQELIDARTEILDFALPAHPEPPRLDLDAPAPASLNDDWEQLHTSFAKFCDLLAAWNHATQRGNWRFKPPEQVPSLEDWIRRWLDSPGFNDFIKWLRPWIKGGYGLYRDCE